jgi:DNA-binding transcriptional LysR family regulator
MAIRQIDLNLFKVFEAVMQHRSVSRASRELGITASAVSHALARLRFALDDELFVASDSGMEPTPRARALAPEVSSGLRRLGDAVGATAFIPATTARTFRLAATDYVSTIVLPSLLARLATSAPQAGLRIVPFNRLDAIQQLDDGRLDLALGWFAELPARMRRTSIATEHEAIVVRAGHDLAQGTITRERLLAYPHIVVELTGTEEQAQDGFLDDRGVWRRVWIERLLIEAEGDAQATGKVGRVAVSVPHYASVAPMLLETDMVATLPRSLALRAAERGELVMLDLPYAPLQVQIEAIWHERAERDAGCRWLIDELIAATAAKDS